MSATWKKISQKIRDVFELKNYPVGVKIIREKVNENILKNPLRPKKPIRFCRMVKKASVGSEILATEDDFSCNSPIICLGFEEPKYVNIEPRVKPASTKAVLVAPLDKINLDPDIILMVLNPKQMMEWTRAIQIRKQEQIISVSFGARIAVCGEATAKPYMEQKPNISMLCYGARLIGKYEDDELVFGIPSAWVREMADSSILDKIKKIRGAEREIISEQEGNLKEL